MAQDTPEARANRLASMTRSVAPAAPAADPGAGAHQGRSRLKGAATIERARIIPDPSQPRTEFDAEALEQLAGSLKSRGQLQPIRVRWDEGRGAYLIVLGERRWRAAGLAGLETLECVVDDEPATAEDLLEDQMVENCLRQDLRPIEQARAYRRLMESRGISLRALAERLHVSPAAISKALATLELPEAIRESVDAGAIGADVAYQLTQVADPADQLELAQAVVAEKLTRSEVAEAVRAVRARRPAPAARPQPVEVDLGDGTLVKISWKRPNATTALQAARKAVKVLQERERGGEVDAA
jgi:ParB family transcriptional regulator, chromosome partitioning protein